MNKFEAYGLRAISSGEYRYIGISSKGADYRLRRHWEEANRGSALPVHNWMKKHGKDQIVSEVLAVGLSYKELEELEIALIKKYKEAGHDLLNLTDGGGGTVGFVHRLETREAWRISRKGSITGEKNPNWGKFGPAHPSYGREASESERAKAREAKLGERNPNFGKVFTEEEKKAMSEKLKGIPKPKSAPNAHRRHHVNKGISKPETCRFCREGVI